jgi:hypothetical protein
MNQVTMLHRARPRDYRDIDAILRDGCIDLLTAVYIRISLDIA